jgi:3',5'-cyclic AMP phosphodiesterase CpdA
MLFNKTILRALALFIILSVLLFGCQWFPKSISSKYEILPTKPNGYALSKRMLLVADNQLNHLYGDPVWLRNELFDHVVNVAIRPVQQDLFGQDILKWIIKYYGSKKWTNIVHLGDGTNMACMGEFSSFRAIMNIAGNPWYMAPGNHDVYLLGNLHNTDQDWWENACKRAQGPMTKDRFVKEYLKHLATQHPKLGKYIDNHPYEGEWRRKADDGALLRAAAWKIDREHPYRSYVLQELDIARDDSDLPLYAILMDSTQFENAPGLVPVPPMSYNAGINGSILPEQRDMAERWLKDNPSVKKMTILMVHHPYASLTKASKEAIAKFRSKYSIPLYVSGHTHHGEYFVRGGDNGWLELNVGSTVDWPIEFRTLQVYQIEEDPENLIFRTPVFRIPGIWEKGVPPKKVRPNTLEWEIKETDAKDFYLAHNYRSSPNPGKTQTDLLEALLHTYKRLLLTAKSAEDNPVWVKGCSSDDDVIDAIETSIRKRDTNEMTSLLIALGDFDQNRKLRDPLIQRDYRLYQAVWASKYDKLKGRKPVVTDPYIRFPKGE